MASANSPPIGSLGPEIQPRRQNSGPHSALRHQAPAVIDQHPIETHRRNRGHSSEDRQTGYQGPHFIVESRIIVTQEDEHEQYRRQADRNRQAGAQHDAGNDGQRAQGRSPRSDGSGPRKPRFRQPFPVRENMLTVPLIEDPMPTSLAYPETTKNSWRHSEIRD